jgi:hypothetical protein
LDGQVPLVGSQITLELEHEAFGGNAGCNSYGGSYEAAGDGILSFVIADGTAVGCEAPADILEQEAEYLELLNGMSTYEIHGDQLRLESDERAVLIFRSLGDCSGPEAFPTEDAEVVLPTLVRVQPRIAAPGDQVEVQGVGGYLYWENECGQQWLESARDFQLLYDGEIASSIQCYANTCLGTLIIPALSQAGKHEISVEGGSSLSIEVRN